MTTVLYQSDEWFDGFTIRFEALPELESIQDLCADADEVLADIQNHRVLLFTARVTAWRAGVELAETFLGGCMYAAYADFANPDGYYFEMRHEAVAAAKIKILLLQKPDLKRAGVES